MATCEDYEGTYEVTQTSCTEDCTIPPGSTIVISCDPMTFTLNSQPYSAEVDSEDHLVVPALDLVASVTGSDPNRFLFGVAGTDGMMGGGNEVWGAEQG